jgi:O-antigen/teichoic acid export membrane protein
MNDEELRNLRRHTEREHLSVQLRQASGLWPMFSVVSGAFILLTILLLSASPPIYGGTILTGLVAFTFAVLAIYIAVRKRRLRKKLAKLTLPLRPQRIV